MFQDNNDCVIPEYFQQLSDEEFFELDDTCYLDYDYDEIENWYSQGPHPIVHVYGFWPEREKWDTWARYCYEAACRDHPIALAKYAFFCEHGIGCGKSLKTAAECYARGAELGEVHCMRALTRINSWVYDDEPEPESQGLKEYKTSDRSLGYHEVKELLFRAEAMPFQKENKIHIIMEGRDAPQEIFIAYRDDGYHMEMKFPAADKKSGNDIIMAGNSLPFHLINKGINHICYHGWDTEDIPDVMCAIAPVKNTDAVFTA